MRDFDPMQDVRFRGKLIAELTREEMQEALVQSLKEAHRLRQPHSTDSYLDASGWTGRDDQNPWRR